VIYIKKIIELIVKEINPLCKFIIVFDLNIYYISKIKMITYNPNYYDICIETLYIK